MASPQHAIDQKPVVRVDAESHCGMNAEDVVGWQETASSAKFSRKRKRRPDVRQRTNRMFNSQPQLGGGLGIQIYQVPPATYLLPTTVTLHYGTPLPDGGRAMLQKSKGRLPPPSIQDMRHSEATERLIWTNSFENISTCISHEPHCTKARHGVLRLETKSLKPGK